jgi:hypothetical protein
MERVVCGDEISDELGIAGIRVAGAASSTGWPNCSLGAQASKSKNNEVRDATIETLI